MVMKVLKKMLLAVDSGHREKERAKTKKRLVKYFTFDSSTCKISCCRSDIAD